MARSSRAAERVATLIEFSHRLTSGAALAAVVFLLIWTWRACRPGHPARSGAALSLFFMLTEAGVGAGLVLFQLVADNASFARAMFLAVHLVNTFTLLACLTATAWWLSGGAPLRLQGRRGRAWSVAAVVSGRADREHERRHRRARRYALSDGVADRGTVGRSLHDLSRPDSAAGAASRFCCCRRSRAYRERPSAGWRSGRHGGVGSRAACRRSRCCRWAWAC